MSREENRARMPACTAFIDEMRAVFGADCKVTYACENGIELGEKFDESTAVQASMKHNWEEDDEISGVHDTRRGDRKGKAAVRKHQRPRKDLYA